MAPASLEPEFKNDLIASWHYNFLTMYPEYQNDCAVAATGLVIEIRSVDEWGVPITDREWIIDGVSPDILQTLATFQIGENFSVRLSTGVGMNGAPETQGQVVGRSAALISQLPSRDSGTTRLHVILDIAWGEIHPDVLDHPTEEAKTKL